MEAAEIDGPSSPACVPSKKAVVDEDLDGEVASEPESPVSPPVPLGARMNNSPVGTPLEAPQLPLEQRSKGKQSSLLRAWIAFDEPMPEVPSEDAPILMPTPSKTSETAPDRLEDEDDRLPICGAYLDNHGYQVMVVEKAGCAGGVQVTHGSWTYSASLDGKLLRVNARGWAPGILLDSGNVKFADGGFWTRTKQTCDSQTSTTRILSPLDLGMIFGSPSTDVPTPSSASSSTATGQAAHEGTPPQQLQRNDGTTPAGPAGTSSGFLEDTPAESALETPTAGFEAPLETPTKVESPRSTEAAGALSLRPQIRHAGGATSPVAHSAFSRELARRTARAPEHAAEKQVQLLQQVEQTLVEADRPSTSDVARDNIKPIRTPFDYDTVPPRLQEEARTLLTKVVINPYVLDNASEELMKHRSFALALVRRNALVLEESPDLARYRGDRSFMLDVVAQQPFALKYASLQLKADPEIIEMAVAQDDRAILYADQAAYKKYLQESEDSRQLERLKAIRNFEVAALFTEWEQVFAQQVLECNLLQGSDMFAVSLTFGGRKYKDLEFHNDDDACGHLGRVATLASIRRMKGDGQTNRVFRVHAPFVYPRSLALGMGIDQQLAEGRDFVLKCSKESLLRGSGLPLVRICRQRYHAACSLFAIHSLGPPCLARGAYWQVERFAGIQVGKVSEIEHARIADLADLLSRIHSLPTMWFDKFRSRLRSRFSWLSEVSRASHVWAYNCVWAHAEVCDALDDKILRAWIGLTGHYPVTAPGRRIVTCHGDFHPGNILRRRTHTDELVCIDLEWCCVTFAIHDVALAFRLYLNTYKERYSFAEAYLKAAGFPSDESDVRDFIFDAQCYKIGLPYYPVGPWLKMKGSRHKEHITAEQVHSIFEEPRRFYYMIRSARSGRDDADVLRSLILTGGLYVTFFEHWANNARAAAPVQIVTEATLIELEEQHDEQHVSPGGPPSHAFTAPAARESAHCFLPGTLVHTKNYGPIRVDEVREGFVLQSGLGLAKVVSSTRCAERERDIVQITYASEQSSSSPVSTLSITSNHAFSVKRHNQNYSTLPAGDLVPGDSLRTRHGKEVVVCSCHEAVTSTSWIELEFQSKNSVIYVGEDETPHDAFVEVYGALAPRPAEDWVKKLMFKNFDNFKQVLLESDELRPCREALERIGMSADLSQVSDVLGPAKMFVDASIALRVVAKLEEQGKWLTPRCVVVSRAFERLVLDAVLHQNGPHRPNRLKDASGDFLDLSRAHYLWLHTDDLTILQPVRAGEWGGAEICVQRTFLDVHQFSMDAADDAQSVKVQSEPAGHAPNPRRFPRR